LGQHYLKFMEREYNVILKQDVDYDAFWHEMETTGQHSVAVPERAVDIVNNRSVMKRQCHYALTDTEADALKLDPRVLDVEIPPEQQPDLIVGPCAVQRGNWSAFASSSVALNWGMFRCVTSDNSNYSQATDGSFPYQLDGTGVDVVIQDTGCQPDHPEWQDANGVSRFQVIDWYSASGVEGTQNINFYSDYYGHGTHAAGTVAGKTYGWAKNARVYAMHIPLGVAGDEFAIPITTSFDCILGWHLNKPIDPVTGFRRPTVVSASWGSFNTYTSFDGVEYRGNDYGDQVRTDLGMTSYFNDNRFSARNSTYDASVSELIDNGIMYVHAAGNNTITADVPGGADYDNNIFEEALGFIQYNRRYYQRGMSPSDPSQRSINVGSAAILGFSSPPNNKASYSNTGNFVDLFAPGDDIISTWSNLAPSGITYPQNPSFQIQYLSGTSMACPQVAGFVACLYQRWPGATVEFIKNQLISSCTAIDVMRASASYTDYTDSISVRGTNRFLFMNQFASVTNGSMNLDGVSVTNLNLRF
jgi:subtilisin family serine protease